ncbi:MAG: DinB family protein [Vicingaceae bacterium]
MINFFTDIFEFHHKLNQLLINQMIEVPDKLSQKATLLLCHSLNAHQIWNSRITNEQPIGVFEIHSLNDCFKLNQSNFDKTKIILQDENFQTNVSYQNSKGVNYNNTVQQILFHISNHNSYHRGQLISELKNQGIEPIISDYICYRRTEI